MTNKSPVPNITTEFSLRKYKTRCTMMYSKYLECLQMLFLFLFAVSRDNSKNYIKLLISDEKEFDNEEEVYGGFEK